MKGLTVGDAARHRVGTVRRSLSAVVLCSLIPFAAAAQVSEVIEVRVVEVEVVVVDGHGQPVRGLTKEDFELREGGKAREITNFYAVDRGQMLREPQAETAKGAPPPEPPLPAPPTHIVFFVDNDHLELRQRNRVLVALRRFVEANVKEGVDASLVTYDHDAKVRVPFTNDRARIIAAIDDMEHESARMLEHTSERRTLIRRIDQSAPEVKRPTEEPDQLWRAVMTYAESQGRDVENSVLAVSDALKRLRGAPGRKVLVHVSSGLQLQPGLEMMDYWRQTFHADPGVANMAGLQVQKSNSFKRMIADANASGITIDTIDASGLNDFEGSSEMESSAGTARLDSNLMRDNRRQPLKLIAEETGGRSIINENDFDRALLQIGTDTTTYYSLGFRGDGGAGLRNVDVRVKRPGLTVRTAKAYRDRTAEERIRDAVESAFDFPFESNPLGVTLATGAPREDAGGFAVPLTVTVTPSKVVALPGPGGHVAHMRCYYEVRDDGGGSSALRVVDQDLTMDERQGPRQLTRVAGIRLRHGKYTISVAVRDLSTNETSYAQRAIEIP